MPSRILHFTSLIFTLCAGISLASPIEEGLDSLDALTAAGVKLDAARSTDGEPSVTFKVTWTPSYKDPDENSPNSMTLLLRARDKNGALINDPFATATLRSRYPADRDGHCHADFTLAEKELPAAELLFHLSQEIVYRLPLANYPKATTNPPVLPMPAGTERALVKAILTHLREATTIVIADFKEPEGTVIREIIRGDEPQFKVGQCWNEPSFPRGPVLIHQRASDTIGNARGIISSTGHYPLDETKRFIVLRSRDGISGNTEKSLVPLADILQQLKTP